MIDHRHSGHGPATSDRVSTGADAPAGTGVDTGIDVDPDTLGCEMADALTYTLDLERSVVDQRWREAFAAVRRHRFVPAWFERDRRGRFWRVDAGQPRRWLDGIYSDRALPIGWGKADYGGQPVDVVTAGATQPSVLAEILQRAQLRPGQRVLYIGTGPGYGTALAAHLVGAGQVTSIEIDPGLADAARTRLDRLAVDATVAVGSGFDPPPVPGGYDRIISTCAVPRIPSAWRWLLAPGGRIVTPLTFGAALVVLDDDTDHPDDGLRSSEQQPRRRRGERPGEHRGGAARLRGRVVPDPAVFLPMRAGMGQPVCAPAPPPASRAARYAVSDTDIGLLHDRDFAFWLTVFHPELLMTGHVHDRFAAGSVQIHTPGAVASADAGYVHGARVRGWLIEQDFHQLWDLVEAVAEQWARAGRPGRDQAEFVVEPGGEQYIALADDRRGTGPSGCTTGPDVPGAADVAGVPEGPLTVELPAGEARITPTPWPRRSMYLDGGRPCGRPNRPAPCPDRLRADLAHAATGSLPALLAHRAFGVRPPPAGPDLN